MGNVVGVGGEARQDSKRELSKQPNPYPASAGPGWKSLGGLQLAIGRLQLTPSSVLLSLYK